MNRVTAAETLMEIARVTARRGTCTRAQVGAVIVGNGHVLSSGYNGAPQGQPHCLDIGCLVHKTELPSGEVELNCRRTVHAEANAIVQAALHGTSIRGAWLYCTHSPCPNCYMLILNAGIAKVIYEKPYKLETLQELRDNNYVLNIGELEHISKAVHTEERRIWRRQSEPRAAVVHVPAPLDLPDLRGDLVSPP